MLPPYVNTHEDMRCQRDVVHGAQMRSEGEQRGVFSFRGNQEELCEGKVTALAGRRTGLERSRASHKLE